MLCIPFLPLDLALESLLWLLLLDLSLYGVEVAGLGLMQLERTTRVYLAVILVVSCPIWGKFGRVYADSPIRCN